eukprot:1295477-Heterocapsa_arctica.AAC.1
MTKPNVTPKAKPLMAKPKVESKARSSSAKPGSVTRRDMHRDFGSTRLQNPNTPHLSTPTELRLA